jgi:DNA-binding response OmpR family regulator
MKTILIIEDDPEINDMLRILLRQNGYQTVSAYSGTEGLLAHGPEIDLILLDLMLPGKSGEEIIADLKAKHKVPVIVTSAIHDVGKKVDLFARGADDYVTKPFHNDELLARIAVRIRSSDSPAIGDASAGQVLTYRDLTLNKADYSVVCAEQNVDLSRHEFALLQMLMENPNRTCTKSMIYDKVWDYESSGDDNTLNVHISKLRKKLKDCQPDADYIETVWGIGYRLKK